MGTHLLHVIRVYTGGRVDRREVTRATAKRQQGVLRTFASTFGDRPIKDMSKADIERWISTRSHIAPGTRKFEVTTMRGFVKWLQIERHLRHNPMLQIKNPKVPRRVPRALTPEQTDALWAALPDNRARAIYALMLWCGLRRCEVIRVEVGDWDRHAGTLHVIGKGQHERDVPITDRAARALDAYLDETYTSAGLMIRRHNGRSGISNDYLGDLMRAWMEAAGVKNRARDGKGCHSLRHTLASNVADVEPDLRITQELLGHQSLQSTEIYLRRARLTAIRAAMEAAA